MRNWYLNMVLLSSLLLMSAFTSQTHAQLSGNYTINPLLPTSGTNFQYFSEVLSALNSVGVSGSTVFNIASGTYDTLLTFPATIPGMGAAAPITFQSATGNAANVVLKHNGVSSANNFIININGAKFLTFRNLTFQSMGTSFGTCIVLSNNCKNILIENNIITGQNTVSTSTDMALIKNLNTSVDSNILINNNQIQKGSYGIFLSGVNYSPFETGNVIENNTISNYYNTGIYSYYQNGIIIRENSISTSSAYSYTAGMSLYYNDFAIVENNKIDQPRYYGLYLSYCNGSGSLVGKITNNFISVGGFSNSYGLYIINSTYYDIFHNSVHCYNSNTSSNGLFYGSSNENNTLNNNIFANTGGGYAFYATSTTFSSNYNNLYSSGTYLGFSNGANRTNLSAWQSATGQDGNSKSINPTFFSNSDLHTLVSGLNNQGTPVNVLEDIDGELRSIGVPDIGADEYAPLAGEISVIAASSPISGCGLNSELVTITLKNNGYSAISGNLNASYIVNAQAPVTEPIATTIPAGGSFVFTFATPVNLAAGASDIDFDFTIYADLVGDPIKYNDTIRFTTASMHAPVPPTVSNASTLYGTSTTLTALSTDTIKWFADAALTNLLYTGSSFTTPILYDTTIYYVASTAGFEYNYTFDTDLQGWTSLTPCSYTNFNWAWASDGGNGTAYMTDPNENSSSILKSPSIAVYGDELTLSFRHKYGFELNFDNGYVAYRIDGGAWTHFTPSTGTYFATDYLPTDPIFASCTAGPTVGVYSGSSSYSTASGVIDLDGGSQIEIAFVFSSDVVTGNTGWFIDNVSLVSEGCQGIATEDTVFVTGIAANDLGVISIIQPVSGFELTSESVEVQVSNFGTGSVTGFNISYSINGGTPVNEFYAGTINSGQTITYTFSQNANLSVFTTYNLKAYTSYSGDAISFNDTAFKSITNTTVDYCISAAQQIDDEDIGNVTFAGINNSSPTPYGALYSNYAATVAPAVVSPGLTYPISITIVDAEGAMFFDGYCEVYIDYNKDGVFTEPDEIAFGSSYIGANSSILTGMVSIPPSASNGITTQMRIVAKENGDASTVTPCGLYPWGETEDYLVTINNIIPKDAGVTSILLPDYIQTEGLSSPVIVDVYNYGSTTLTNIPVEYIANGAPAVSYNWYGTLDPGQTVQISLPAVSILPGNNSMCAYTVVAGDSIFLNDESCAQFYGLPPIVLFEDDMENGTLLYTDAPSLWEHGVPTASIINSAHSPDSVWGTVLAGNYPPSASGFLYLPPISFIGINDAYLTFHYWIDAEESLDGAYLQYSINNGTTWFSLGSINDSNGYNWFDSNISGTFGWSIDNNNWTPAFMKLDAVSGNNSVLLRFGFKSNNSINYNGFAIDDIKILAPKAAMDAGITDIIAPFGSTQVGLQTSVEVNIKNFGTNILTSIPLAYRLNSSSIPQIETWTGTLAPDSTTTYSFAGTYLGPTENYSLCAFTLLSGDPFKTNDTTCVDLTLVGIEDMTRNGVVLMQNNPNPTSAETEISFTLPEPGNCVITLRNTLGELIQTTQLSGQTGKNTFSFNASNLEQGIYFYTLEYKDVVLTRRLSVIR